MDFNVNSSIEDEGRVLGLFDEREDRLKNLSDAVTREAQLMLKARAKLIPFRKECVQRIHFRGVDDEIREMTA